MGYQVVGSTSLDAEAARVLYAVHRRAVGGIADLEVIQRDLGLSDARTALVISLLEVRGYIRMVQRPRQPDKRLCSITQEGTKVAVITGPSGTLPSSASVPSQRPDMDALSASSRRPHHAAVEPSVVVNVSGDVRNSAIQIESPGATQQINAPTATHGAATAVPPLDIAALVVGDAAARCLRFFLDWYDKYATHLREEVGSEWARVIGRDVETIRVQLSSSDPRRQIVQPCVDEIRNTFDRVTGGAVAIGLRAMLAEVEI